MTSKDIYSSIGVVFNTRDFSNAVVTKDARVFTSRHTLEDDPKKISKRKKFPATISLESGAIDVVFKPVDNKRDILVAELSELPDGIPGVSLASGLANLNMVNVYGFIADTSGGNLSFKPINIRDGEITNEYNRLFIAKFPPDEAKKSQKGLSGAPVIQRQPLSDKPLLRVIFQENRLIGIHSGSIPARNSLVAAVVYKR